VEWLRIRDRIAGDSTTVERNLFRAKLSCSFNDLKGLGGLRKYWRGRKRDIHLGWTSWVWQTCFGALVSRKAEERTSGMERATHLRYLCQHGIIWPDCITSRLVRTTVEDRQSRPPAADVQRFSNAEPRIPIRSTGTLHPAVSRHNKKSPRGVPEIA
jgi:hypothetical protein